MGVKLQIGLPVFHISSWAVEFGRLSTHKAKQDDTLTYSDRHLHASAFASYQKRKV